MASKPKKLKLSFNGGRTSSNVTDKLTAIDLKFTSAPTSLAKDMISSLKVGIGLVGNEAEEEEFYQEYVKGQQAEANAQEIGSVDVETTKPDSHSRDGGSDNGDVEQAQERSLQVQKGKPKKKKKKKKKKTDSGRSDEDIDLDDAESPTSSQDYVEFEGKICHLEEIIGDEWVKVIKALHEVEPLKQPANMTISLHDYQLKGAAQMEYLCKSVHKGGILADGMGLGKTATAIHCMFMVKDDPGFSLVVTPKSLCIQWVNAIRDSFEPGFGLRVYYLETSHITAHELLALGVDIIVCSYDLVAASLRAFQGLPEKLDAFTNDQNGFIQQPKRPNAPLHSKIWRLLNLPIKLLVLDEAQFVNKHHGIKHKALKALYYKAVLMLSGTPGHNHYHGFSGLVSFLKGHPFITHKSFMKAFSSIDYNGKVGPPDPFRVILLQRFLQAFTIARPSDILKLPNCTRFRSSFTIREEHEAMITALFAHYAVVQLMSSKRSAVPLYEHSTDAKALTYAVQSQMISLHPMLYKKERDSQDHDFLDGVTPEEAVLGFINADDETKGGETRDLWLQKLRDTDDDTLIGGSDRLLQFLRVFKQLRTTNPSQRMVVFSQYLKFLDIIAEALERKLNIRALRYDGTVHSNLRPSVEQAFKICDPSIPLLITAGAGSVGLNITAASICIQSEIWWNVNNEWQALKRVWRQLQTSEVVYIQLFSPSSAVDCGMWGAQTKKADIYKVIMDGIIRRPDEEPLIRKLLFPRNYGTEKYAEYDSDEFEAGESGEDEVDGCGDEEDEDQRDEVEEDENSEDEFGEAE